MRNTKQAGLALILLFAAGSIVLVLNSGFDVTDEPADQNFDFVHPLTHEKQHVHAEEDPYLEFHQLDDNCVPADVPPIKNIKSSNTAKAAFTYLAPRLNFFRETKRLYLLLMSLQRLEVFYYRALGLYTVDQNGSITYDYPIIIFHEDYTETEMNFLRSHMIDPNFPLLFHKVDFNELPACAGSMEQVMKWNIGEEGGEEGRPLGYRQMCRMWSGIAQNLEVFKDFEFYLRLDDDTMLLGPPKYDVFQYMKDHNLSYVYQQTAIERDIEALWYWVERWNMAHGIPWNARHNFGFFDGVKDGVLAVYNNFHASRLDLWRSSLWKDFFQFIEHNSGCGFLKYVWGDATFHSAFISSTLRKDQVGIIPFADFPYSHREIKDNMFYTGWDEWTRPLCRT